jgi:hypothetical protein
VLLARCIKTRVNEADYVGMIQDAKSFPLSEEELLQQLTVEVLPVVQLDRDLGTFAPVVARFVHVTRSTDTRR